jgi:DNA polymerase III subunit delta
MTYENIIEKIKKRIFAPVYFLAGEEPYFIDRISKLLEQTVVEPECKDFDQDIVYGRDVTPEQVFSLCRAYPLMGAHRLVIVREAQNIKDLVKDQKEIFKNYLKNPTPTTILVFDYKYKKIDGRTSFAQAIAKKAVFLDSAPIRDYKIPEFIESLIRNTSYKMSPVTREILAQNIGNNLSKIENEIEKLFVNLRPGVEITPEIIEEYIGISKDYNIFELQNALLKRDVMKANRIINYFAQNPKDNSAIKNMTFLFGIFRKIFHYHFIKNKSDKRLLAAELKVNPFFLQDYQIAAGIYSPKKLAQIFALLREYDQKTKGVETATIDESELMKELIFKILH